MRSVHLILTTICVAFAAGAQTSDGLEGKVYYIAPNMKLPDFDRLEPVGTIYTNPMFVGPSNSTVGFPGIPDRHGWFAIDYRGKIYIRDPGKYYFELISDDGAKFYIDGKVVIDNDHGLGDWTGYGTVQLSGGMHRVRLSYFQGPRDHHCIELRLKVTPPKGKDQAFDMRNFYPPARPGEWKYGSPADFDEAPATEVTRVRLKDVIGTEGGVSEKDLVAAVRSEMQKHTSDKSLARSLGKFVLKEKLDPIAIEVLQSEGAGPETVAALERLRENSAGLPAATQTPAFKFPTRPSLDEQTQFFRQLSRNALHYSASLPDFICTEVIRRFTSPVQPKPEWKAQDVLTVKLTYFDNNEKYELTLINGHKTARGYETTGGAISRGDFGSQLLEIFDPDTETKFQWDHWTRLRKRLTQVYSYRTLREHSHYKLTVGRSAEERQTVGTGRHGFIYADNETHMVMRVTGEADSIQPGFPVKAQSGILDYEIADVGGRQYLLPLRSEQHMKDSLREFRNVEEFRDYRKFVGESTISFGNPEPGPAPNNK